LIQPGWKHFHNAWHQACEKVTLEIAPKSYRKLKRGVANLGHFTSHSIFQAKSPIVVEDLNSVIDQIPIHPKDHNVPKTDSTKRIVSDEVQKTSESVSSGETSGEQPAEVSVDSKIETTSEFGKPTVADDVVPDTSKKPDSTNRKRKIPGKDRIVIETDNARSSSDNESIKNRAGNDAGSGIAEQTSKLVTTSEPASVSIDEQINKNNTFSEVPTEVKVNEPVKQVSNAQDANLDSQDSMAGKSTQTISQTIRTENLYATTSLKVIVETPLAESVLDKLTNSMAPEIQTHDHIISQTPGLNSQNLETLQNSAETPSAVPETPGRLKENENDDFEMAYPEEDADHYAKGKSHKPNVGNSKKASARAKIQRSLGDQELGKKPVPIMNEKSSKKPDLLSKASPTFGKSANDGDDVETQINLDENLSNVESEEPEIHSKDPSLEFDQEAENLGDRDTEPIDQQADDQQ
jgi:hypothetical protein